MNKQECKNLYEEIEEIRKERDITINQVQKMDKDIEIKLLEYRIKSVKRVLDYMNNKCWKKENIPELHNKIVHCLNKLNGNIDGIELTLEEGLNNELER
jgi:hypothetical protein